jgi:hypothetical protein
MIYKKLTNSFPFKISQKNRILIGAIPYPKLTSSLYAENGLTQEEITFIEEKVYPMG